MNRAIPFLAALQWVGGIALAYAAVRRGHQLRPGGRWPSGVGRAAAAVFIVAAVLVILTLPGIAPWIARPLPVFADADRWRLGTFLQLSQVAWILVIVASAWNGVLGIMARKRIARAELARRRARVRGRHDEGQG